MLRGEATNTNFIVFGLTRPGLEPTIYRTRGVHDAVAWLCVSTRNLTYKLNFMMTLLMWPHRNNIRFVSSLDDTCISVTLVLSNLFMFYFNINISYSFTSVIIIPFQPASFYWSLRTKPGDWVLMHMFLIGIDFTFTFMYV